MANKPVVISNFNAGGTSDSKWSGIQDSLYRMVGLDPHSEPAVLKAEYKLSKDSGDVITEFVKWQVVSSNGHTYHFSADSGKIWERDDAGATTLVYTATAGAGEVKCLGAIEFQGYIIWATQSRLHRIAATDALGAAEWTAHAATGLNWQTFGTTNLKYHPMIEQNMNLYIGDGYNLAEWDGSAFTASALDLPTSLVIKCLGTLPVGTDVLIGTEGNDVTKTAIFRWNTWSVSFTSSDMIEETGINAFLKADNFVYVSAGEYGNIYVYDGSQLELYKKVQGTYSPAAKATVHPDAVANLDGQVLFGVSNSTGNPCLQGVYRIGRHSRNYNWIVDLAYPISERATGAFVLSSIEIGSIIVLGQKILVSWKNGSTYGVDLLDTSNRCDGAYFETRVIRADRLVHSTFSEFVMAYNSLPASTALTLTYDKNYAGSYTTPTSSQVTDIDRKTISLEEGIEATALQLKVLFTCSTSSTPSLEMLAIYYT
jgi:hypothetical protein